MSMLGSRTWSTREVTKATTLAGSLHGFGDISCRHAGPEMSRMVALITCLSFDFDNTLLLSERAKRSALEELAASFQGGASVLSTIHTDSRTAPPGYRSGPAAGQPAAP